MIIIKDNKRTSSYDHKRTSGKPYTIDHNYLVSKVNNLEAKLFIALGPS